MKTDKAKAIETYLKIINKCTKHTEVVYKGHNGTAITFEIQLKPDPFIIVPNHPLNVSDEFDKINNTIFQEIFGKLPTYNNTHNTFWTFPN